MRFYPTLFLVIFLTGINHSLFSQAYVFKVLANKGENTVASDPKGANWLPVKTGSVLKDGDQVKVSSNAYLGLVHANGKTLEIKEPGKYHISELSGKVNATNNGIASKYADFVLSKMSGQDDENIDNNAKKYQNATGSVERATGSEAINVLLPVATSILSPQTSIRWTAIEEDQVYIVTIKNSFDEEILTKEVNTASYDFSFEESALKGEDFVILSVQAKGNEGIQSGEFGLKRASKSVSKDVLDELDQLKTELGNTALDNLILASFFEQNSLVQDAHHHYVQAMELSPSVEAYKNLYLDFLVRNGLIK